MIVARVIVDIPTREVSGPFDYLVTPEFAAICTVGCAVLVDFGNRPAVGWVVGMSPSSDVERLKPVRQVLSESRFDQVSAELALQIAEEYVCPPAEAIRLFLPPGTAPKAERLESPDGVVSWRLKKPANRPVTEWIVQRVAHSDFTPTAAAKAQRAVLDALSAGPLTASELSAELGGVSATIKRLEAVGALTRTERRRFRSVAGSARADVAHEALSAGQAAALEACEAAVRDAGVVLLDGVTGSGKTEVYLRAIAPVLEAGRGAIVLVPEISLTPQTVGRFRARFGDLVAVMHSRLGAGERLDEWERVASGEATVLVGARSALFAPMRDLGLVVIDEEHEGSYKQGSAPRYHAREVAVRICAARGAGLVLGSATPSLESLHRVAGGQWASVGLPERVAGGSLPPVTVVDMASEFAEGNRSIFSRTLRRRLEEVAEKGHKAVLLLNRRGYASFLLCRECSYVPECDSCSTSMTFHETGPVLACHHCGARRAVPVVCPRCGSAYLRRFGAGTQRVVGDLEALIPDLKIVRMDADTTTGKGGHERCLSEFEALDSGVLVGTQMVAKGLDYPDVTLVGVLSADLTLHVPDARAAERTWQLLSQVSGRAGRGPLGGTVVIQTYWPDHPAILAAATGERGPFIAEEMAQRKALAFPPFGRLANIVVSSADSNAAHEVTEQVAARLRDMVDSGITVLGPSPAPMARVKRNFRWHVLVKAPAGADIAAPVRLAVTAIPKRQGTSIAIDIDPIDLL
ncbi:MAG: replication restart helicase PriA [Coriobacteriia bacterium]